MFLKKNKNLIELKLSILQVVGIVVITIGVIGIIISAIANCSSIVSVSFFIIMLGFAFAFPTLLQGSEGLSTMRIVVFMMVNVICLLLLKIGWEQNSLTNIGLNQYWKGVIAFVFGAKATQSYFESKFAVPEVQQPKVGIAAINFTNADIAKLAVEQNQQYLKVKFPNIVSISDAVHDLNQTETHVIAIYIKDNITIGIPDKLEVKMPDGSTKIISTEIIKEVGAGGIQFSQASTIISDINSPKYEGSICCAVKSASDEKFVGIITSAHIYTNGRYDDQYNGILNIEQQRVALLNGIEEGNWFINVMNQQQDLAIIKLKQDQILDTNYKYFNNEYYYLSDSDVQTQDPNVTIISKKNNIRDGYILDYNVGLDITYEYGSSYKKNIILIGKTNNRAESQPISAGGDSGSCVYHKKTQKLIGMLLGGNLKYSFVLPLDETLSTFNFKTV